MQRARTVHSLACYYLPLPTSNKFVHFVFANIPGQSAWGVLSRRPSFVCFSGNCIASELESLRFRTSDTRELSLAGSSCTIFLDSVQCFVHKNAFKGVHFSRYIRPFDRIPRIWVIIEVLVCPSWIYCTLKPRTVYLVPGLFIPCCWHYCAPWILLFIHKSIFVRPHLDYYVNFPRKADFPVFKWMSPRSRSGRTPLLVLTVPEVLHFCLTMFS